MFRENLVRSRRQFGRIVLSLDKTILTVHAAPPDLICGRAPADGGMAYSAHFPPEVPFVFIAFAGSYTMRRFGHRTTGLAKSRGFTLIELMIVLAIIGVLVTAGVPYLQNYLVRARVVEGLGAAASAKALVSENAMHGAPFNSGWQAPSATDNVNAVTIDSVSGNVTVAYTQRAGDGALVLVPTSAGPDGKPMALTVGKAPEGQIVWTCYAQGREGAPGGATLPAKLAPPECRGAATQRGA